jgi:peptidoglycan/LPS O-acetylase OafA/YrhL
MVRPDASSHMSVAAHAAPKRERKSASTVERGRPISFGFIPALDGLRALAVLGVMAYHGGAPIFDGGFLTIDVFFVLSGFLITSLLIGEWRKRSTVQLGQFWARRARRLLPALLVLLLGVAIYAKAFATPGEFANLRLDSLSALFYVSNWHFIFAGTNYFNLTGQPSPLQHMWSLSIEEQFYIVWPPLVVIMLGVGRRLRPSRRLWPLCATALVGAIASAVEMALLYHGPASVMRVYEGTDTRSQDLLVGATLAVGMAIWAQYRAALPVGETQDIVTGRAGRVHPSAGTADTFGPPLHRRDLRRRRGPAIKPVAAWEVSSKTSRTTIQILGWMVIATFAYLWSHLTEPTVFLYRGGYLLVAVGVALVIFAAVTAQLGAISRALGNSVFRYVGKISYGTYLWHFPLFAIVSAERLHLIGYPLLFVRIGITLLVASASFALVEEPIRRGRLHFLTEWRAWLMTSGAVVGVVGIVVVATLPTAADATPTNHPTGAQYSGPPVKVAVFGDSVAARIGFDLELVQQPYDVHVDNGGILGCGVVVSSEYRSHGTAEIPNAPCNAATPASQLWSDQWKGDVAQFRPNVVLMQTGRWEVTDQLTGGQWLHVGEPTFDADLKRSLEEAIRVGTSGGALMILMTAPCYSSGEQDNGQPWPEDSSVRLDAYNSVLRQVASQYPGKVEVLDLGAEMCPGGKFASTIDGVQLRLADGVHPPPTASAGEWLAERVLPETVRVGRLQMDGSDLTPNPIGTTTSPSPTR